MNREIKVRVWTGTEYRYSPPLGEWDFEDCELFAGYNKKTTVRELFTGKRDKARNEVWEGDIIEGNLFDYRVPTMGVVTYDAEHACYASKNEAGLTPLSKIDQIKIISTIHENPELLK